MGKINVENMDLYYGQFHALKNINLDIPEKKITAFIGPSGCGKSTLLKSLNRMNDLVEGCKITGDIRLDGEDIYGNIDVNLLRKRVGMVFQKPNPFPMSIYDNIAYGPRTHGIHSKEKLDDIVERALRNASIWDEVKDRLKKSALGMSGGQQQRLCIARALAVEPEVLLMDEPTSALDPISTSHIEDLALELKDRYTIVIVTHNMQQAARISDKTAFSCWVRSSNITILRSCFQDHRIRKQKSISQGGSVDMRDLYNAKLARLSDEIMEMGNLCGQAIMKTCQLLASVEIRETASKEIGKIEKEIDDKEHNIEALCMQLLLKQQPVGTDLRKISAALKMVTDMERIGDQATDIAEIMLTGSVHVPVTAIPLQEMAEHAMHMVNDSVTAYVEEKSDLAKKVIDSDDLLDNLFNQIRKALDMNRMGYSSDEVLDLLMISKYYERIGDHATNIGEWAEFSVDGIHRNGDSISDLFNPNSL